ncbi:hypothetical protein A3Q56_06511 [Intoshia linei]|uniref:F-box domain-containing protein n=1 Tax=Intoshia linei TaxID=1819745 RepID=A0A177AW05_9BILA|nr:hypothetical protein A3Q56_06511 [Intoshia linei]
MIKNYVLNNGQFFLVDYFKSWNIQQQKCYICSVIERCQPNELCSILDDIYLIFRQDLIMENNVENFSKLCRMNQDVKITIRNRRKSKKKSTTRFLTPNKSTKFTQIFCFQLLYSEYNEKLNNKVFKSKVVSLKSILPIDELNSVSDSENDSNLGFNSISAGPIWSNLNECSDVFQLNLIKYIEKVKKQEKNLEKGKNKKSYGRWKGHGRDNSVLKRNNSHNLNKDLYSFTCNTNDASKRILTLLNVSTNCYPIHSVICASLEQNEENRTFFNQMNFLNRKLNRIIIKELIKEITPHFYLLQFLSIKIISRLIYLNRMDYLSNNIINKIINNLNYKDFCSFMQTNKRFHSICRNNTFWKQATIQLIELTCPLLIKNGINEKDLNRINNVNSDFWNKLNKTVLNNIKSLNLQPQHRLKIKINPPSTINVEQCEDYNNIKLISDENDTFEKNEKKTKLLHENHIPTLDKSVRVKFLNFEDSHKSNKMYVNLHMSQYYSETEFDLNQPFQNDYNENSSIQNKKINSLTDNENVTESETEIDQFMDIRTKLESNQDVLVI